MQEQHERFAEAAEYYQTQRGSAATLDQQMTVAFLRETQEIYGCIPDYALETIAICTGYKIPLLKKLIGLYPSLKTQAACHEIVVCSGSRCGKTNAEWLKRLKKGLEGADPQQVSIRTVNCFKQCGKGPNIQLDGVLYHCCDENTMDEILEKTLQK